MNPNPANQSQTSQQSDTYNLPASPPPAGRAGAGRQPTTNNSTLPPFPNSTLPFIVAGIITVSLVGIGAYLLGKSKNNSNPPIPSYPSTQSVSPIPSPSPTSDPTTNWKIYTNKKYGYTLKYPSSFKEEFKCQGGSIDDDYICFISPDYQANPAPAVLSGGLIWVDGQEKSLGIGYTRKEFCASDSIDAVYQCIDRPIGDYKAIQRTFASFDDLGILKDNKVILAFRAYFTKESKDSILMTRDQILSTFTFTNPAQTANLKTYTNTKYKFSFQYPVDASVKELDNPSANQFQVTLINPSMTLILDIMLLKPDYAKYYLGSPRIDGIVENNITWDILKNTGYCDAGSCGDSFIAYQTIKDNYRYVFIFNKTQEKSNQQTQIVSTFKFQ